MSRLIPILFFGVLSFGHPGEVDEEGGHRNPMNNRYHRHKIGVTAKKMLGGIGITAAGLLAYSWHRRKNKRD